MDQFLRNGCVVPKQKCSAFCLLGGWGLERFERPSYNIFNSYFSYYTSLLLKKKTTHKRLNKIQTIKLRFFSKRVFHSSINIKESDVIVRK